VTIREWRGGHDPNPTMLRRMAGTLVNIAVDCAVEMPGVISTNTARGKALLSFLEAFENIDFAEDGRAEILEGLFTAALETLRDYPAILAEDERARTLLHVVAEGLYEDSRALLAAPPLGPTWKLRFGSAEALQVLEAVVEVVQNPGWFEKKAGDAHPLLGEVTKEVLVTRRTGEEGL